jgi:hypothetical protein
MYDMAAESGDGMFDVEDALDSARLDAIPMAIAAIERGDTLHGLIVLEGLPAFLSTTVSRSYLAYCMARERGQFQRAMAICRSSLTAEPEHPAHYLNLGRVLLLAGDKERAIATFWRGISRNSGPEGAAVADWPRQGRRREHDLIMDELRRLGIRKPPPFRSLHRGHLLNRITGKFLSRIGMR